MGVLRVAKPLTPSSKINMEPEAGSTIVTRTCTCPFQIGYLVKTGKIMLKKTIQRILKTLKEFRKAQNGTKWDP